MDVTFNLFNTLGPGAMMQNVQVLPFLRFLTFISTKNRLYNNIGNSRGDSFENPTKKGMTEKKVMDTMKKYFNKSFSVQILNSIISARCQKIYKYWKKILMNIMIILNLSSMVTFITVFQWCLRPQWGFKYFLTWFSVQRIQRIATKSYA